MKFTKYEGLGNDFILIDNRAQQYSKEQLQKISKSLCQRRISVGADGFMAVFPCAEADFEMYFLNADGTEAEMCGNGARCMTQFAYERGIAPNLMHFKTKAGLIEGAVLPEGKVKIKMNLPTCVQLSVQVKEKGKAFDLSYLELGNPGVPHALLRREEAIEDPLAIARMLRHHAIFPRGANINLYQVLGENHLSLQTYERGVEDFTLTCGTGAAAAAALCILKGILKGPEILVSMPGGDLLCHILSCEGEMKALYQIGPAQKVFEGETEDERGI